MATQKTPIGIRLARYRKECGFKTAEDLALSINDPLVTRSTIVNAELGRKKDLTVNELLLISNALGIPPMALMTDVDHLFTPQGEGHPFADQNSFDMIDWIAGNVSSRLTSTSAGHRLSKITKVVLDIHTLHNELANLLHEVEKYYEAHEDIALKTQQENKIIRSYNKLLEATYSELEGLTGEPMPGSQSAWLFGVSEQ